MSTPGSYPASGRISPTGGSSLTSVPSGAVIVSVVGSKSSRPARAIAITVSGEVTNDNVFDEPSLRFGKLRLYELTIVFGWPVIDSGRDHCPMHGPQAFARTVAPTASRSARRPSRSIVARICSEPGVTSNSVLAVRPLASGLPCDRCHAGDVLVRRVRARPDQGRADLEWPAVLARLGADAVGADAVGAIGGVGAVDHRLELVEVDLDQLVVEGVVIGPKISAATLSAASAIASRPVALR